ncbi:MAG: asparagine synthase (glutamine-hydrolyzing), partial [Cyclobacteriaceae bacterium]|nr:asparagine synthase (glutamine-hydrolyzing) [Cyclobacteriaceae bacterium]
YILKNDLLNKNIVFSSHSDTEVLFHWLVLNGKSGIEKLEGMFAFIFIDVEKDEILIGRDRFGIKPIYYYEDDKCFIASSEIKPIIGTGLMKKELNASQIHHYLSFKYAKQPETLYQNIYELECGSVLCIRNNERYIEHYFQNHIKYNDAFPDLAKIEELITNSLIQQLNVQVPLGLLLSGGVDSTLLLALACKEGLTLPTYSIINSEVDKSFGTKDYHYSRLAASTYSSEHHEIEIDISLLNQFEEFIEKIDQPIGDSSYLMTSEICGNASKSMKILLSGAGADELFAGYNRHWAFYKYLNNKKILDILNPFIKSISKLLPSGFPHPLRKHFRLIKKWSDSFDKSPSLTYLNYLMFNEFSSFGNELNHQYEDNSDLFAWALRHDQNNYLISDVLALSDKASMLHGIELRVPYLDEKLADYLAKIHPTSLIEKGQKWILKELLKKHGGRKFVNRPKEGFGLPLSNWLFDKRIAHLWELFESQESTIFNYLEKKKFDHLVSQQKRKTEDHGPLLWSILVLGHWLQRNFS